MANVSEVDESIQGMTIPSLCPYSISHLNTAFLVKLSTKISSEKERVLNIFMMIIKIYQHAQ